MSSDQASLIAQRKDNQTQTMNTPAMCILKHSVTYQHEQTGRGTPSTLAFPELGDNNLTWQPGGIRNKPAIWSQASHFGETRIASAEHRPSACPRFSPRTLHSEPNVPTWVRAWRHMQTVTLWGLLPKEGDGGRLTFWSAAVYI